VVEVDAREVEVKEGERRRRIFFNESQE